MPLYGPKWPLKSGNADTFEIYESVEQQISFYLKNLMLTSPGENLSDPSYGVGLRRYIFEQNIDSVRSSISSEIQNQMARYLPYLTIFGIEALASSEDIDNNNMTVRITYGIPGDVIQKVFELDVNPEATIGFY